MVAMPRKTTDHFNVQAGLRTDYALIAIGIIAALIGLGFLFLT
jgi:hypothetical protein